MWFFSLKEVACYNAKKMKTEMRTISMNTTHLADKVAQLLPAPITLTECFEPSF